MKFGNGILGVYAPVLLAAVLILTVAPSCIMPSCGLVRGAAVTTCEPPQQQQFTSACELDSEHIPASAPCGSGGCDDTTMSHGTPDATVVQSAQFPTPVASAVAQAPVISPVALLGHTTAVTRLPEIPPPDPLGVRLIV
ncbi:MAG: hypothetical protein D9V44_07595 [Actinobacteria bacterium]|nr:MAG: hypothetical protein D9V44_07595 [Actinomycetota bacterium]